MSGNGTHPRPDPLARAIAAAEPAPQPPLQPSLTAGVKLTSGRVVELTFPADINDLELVDLVGQIVTVIRAEGRKRAAGPRSRLILPGG